MLETRTRPRSFAHCVWQASEQRDPSFASCETCVLSQLQLLLSYLRHCAYLPDSQPGLRRTEFIGTRTSGVHLRSVYGELL